ncbi:response regulator [Desulfopila sp. IMCC35006]|uniref:response regulator n=1 Tax=Desulfopila sp. IMCC35006 TaxID=2569542 RepID=UPI0010AC0E85|nr:response regulator [Desulfopila sp. IMCC35006]TKB27487.1 response regulator [Desulfopila sp. IMCC35006]
MAEIIKAKVLLVDDEELFLTTLAKRLEVRGMQVSTVTRGKDAVAMVDKQAFDLVVLDLSMPGMDGLETLKQIKAKQPDAEIIILTGEGSIRTGIEAMKAGAEDFLQKPVNIVELVNKISEAKDKRMHILQNKSVKDIEQILQTKAW